MHHTPENSHSFRYQVKFVQTRRRIWLAFREWENSRTSDLRVACEITPEVCPMEYLAVPTFRRTIRRVYQNIL